MKKIITILFVLFLLPSLAACSKEEEKEIFIFDAQRELFRYEGTETAEQIAVDENGILYTTEFVYVDKTAAGGYVPFKQNVCTYDLEGNLVNTVELSMGDGTAEVFFAENGKLYFVINTLGEENRRVLYEVDVATWEVKKLHGFDFYKSISDVIRVGEYFYVLGIAKNPEVKNYQLHPEVFSYTYGGEVITRFNATEENAQEEQLYVDFPIDIFRTENGLGIYHYTEENGFGILELDHEEGTLTEQCLKPDSSPSQYFIGCEDGDLFCKTGDGKIFYGTLDGREADVSYLSIQFVPFRNIVYSGGFVFYFNRLEGNSIERICVGDILKDNKTINLLTHKDLEDIPYGCGYQMEKQTLDSDAFALKVLAQDTDYDVYVLSSRDNASYNLKENGAFYPLNEVEGVMEYLDACFPYVKEAAMNEDGDVWMIPVALAIPGLRYNKEYCAEQGVDISTMDFAEFLQVTREIEESEPDKTGVSEYVLTECLFGQYFQQENSFDTERFREYAELFQDIFKNPQGDWHLVSAKLSEEFVYADKQEGNWPEFYWNAEVYQESFKDEAKRYFSNTEDIGAIAIPTMTEEMKNQGTITFLAVNPQSENLETALEYISAFAKHMLQLEDSFILADESTYSDNAYLRDWYQIYANGSIRYDVESEVYAVTFAEYVTGKIELENAIEEMERRRNLYMEE